MNSPAEVTTSGMTAKVLKGSFWVLVGQVLPFLATFIATPFVIHFLGTESYGVLILLGLVANYFSFADFGMGLASTKFGSEAYGERSDKREGAVIITALRIAFFSSVLIAVPLFIFSGFIIRYIFSVPAHLQYAATLGLRITLLSFVFGILSGVLNTPQLTRLRMDLNILINSGGKILMILVTPLVFYFGGGIVEACIVSVTATAIMLAGNFWVSGKLQPAIFKSKFNANLKKELIQFGKSVILYSAATVLIFNAEKLVLSNLTSTKELAYYSVAYTLASMTTMLTLAIGQTLIPAFSQMLAPEKRTSLNLLFNRSFKTTLICLLPTVMVMVVVAKPFFTIWAGKEFGMQSTMPFYILMGGIFFSLLMYIPNSILLAFGKTSIFAKTYWIEILPYILLAFVLIREIGILGAAVVWSLREIINAFVFFWYSRKYTGVSLNVREYIRKFFPALLLLSPPVIFALTWNNFSLVLVGITLVSLVLYLILCWKLLLSGEERKWAISIMPFKK